MAQRLARDHVLATTTGRTNWATLASKPLPVHLSVAGAEGTVCDLSGSDDSIEGLKRSRPATHVVTFDEAAHSIHNTAQPEFTSELLAVITAAVAVRSATLARQDRVTAGSALLPPACGADVNSHHVLSDLAVAGLPPRERTRTTPGSAMHGFESICARTRERLHTSSRTSRTTNIRSKRERIVLMRSICSAALFESS